MEVFKNSLFMKAKAETPKNSFFIFKEEVFAVMRVMIYWNLVILALLPPMEIVIIWEEMVQSIPQIELKGLLR